MNYLFLFICILFLLFSCQHGQEDLQIHLDLEVIPDSLVMFGPGIISTPLYERDMAISPDNHMIIYSLGDYKQTRRCLVVMTKSKGGWSDPKIMSISGTYQDIEPFFDPSGNKLYFASNRPIFHDNSRSDYNIWMSEITNRGWSKPVALDSTINTREDEYFPAVSKLGNLFFTATRPDGLGREDIFRSESVRGQFLVPKPLPKEINTPYYEFNAYVSPDEDLIIFSSFGRKDGLGGGDLYISQKDAQGNWTSAVNMGEVVNSNQLDYCPFIDWTNRNIYFTSERKPPPKGKITSIALLQQSANDVLNGYGNIYRIKLDQLEFF